MANKSKKGETIYALDFEKTLSEVREKKGSGKISLTGRKKVKTVEKEFDDIFGLYVQICWRYSKMPSNSNASYYYSNSGQTDNLTLTALSKEKEAAGCEKGEWR